MLARKSSAARTCAELSNAGGSSLLVFVKLPRLDRFPSTPSRSASVKPTRMVGLGVSEMDVSSDGRTIFRGLSCLCSFLGVALKSRRFVSGTPARACLTGLAKPTPAFLPAVRWRFGVPLSTRSRKSSRSALDHVFAARKQKQSMMQQLIPTVTAAVVCHCSFEKVSCRVWARMSRNSSSEVATLLGGVLSGGLGGGGRCGE
mmetsp:Transcript_6755/g.17669  ORF Transcript_6755/g.17669 Transcript_6755/m.17669 type:complete len:202 (+) Transcript_6755:864-1469(+)